MAQAIKQSKIAPPKIKKAEVPTGVKIISVFYYIFAVLTILVGVLALFLGGLLGGVFGAMGAGLAILVAVIVIAIGVVEIFVARGLWKGRKWARIIVIIFSILGVLEAITGLVQGNVVAVQIVWLLVNAVIGGYLWFSGSVKSAFS